MSFFSKIGEFFGGLIKKAFNVATSSGLTDELVAKALVWVKAAAVKFVDNAAKREWAVAQLVKAKIPESIARLAVELAVQLFKKELDDLGISPKVIAPTV